MGGELKGEMITMGIKTTKIKNKKKSREDSQAGGGDAGKKLQGYKKEEMC